jgi:hypothetical protein
MGHTLDVRVVYIACAPVCAYAHTMFVHVSHSCGDATHTRGRVTRTACYYVRCTPVCARETYSHVAYTPTGTSQPRSPPFRVLKLPRGVLDLLPRRLVARRRDPRLLLMMEPLRADGTHDFVLMVSDYARTVCTINRPYYRGPIIEGFADLKCMTYVHTKVSYANLSDQIIKGFADLKCMVYVRTNSPYTNLIRPDYK